MAGWLGQELFQDGARGGVLLAGGVDPTAEDAVVVGALRRAMAEGELAQDDTGAQGLLGGVIGGLALGMFDEGQQPVAVFDQPLAEGFHLRFGPRPAAEPIQFPKPAGAAGLRGGGGLAGLRGLLPGVADALNPAHQGLEKVPHGAGAPAGGFRGVLQLVPQLTGGAQMMGQAALVMGGPHPVVGGVIVGVQQARERLPQQARGHLCGAMRGEVIATELLVARIPKEMVPAVHPPVGFGGVETIGGVDFGAQVGVKVLGAPGQLPVKAQGGGGHKTQAAELVEETLDFAVGQAHVVAQPGGGGFGDRADGCVAHFAGAGLMDGPLAARTPGWVVAVFGDNGAGNQHDVFLAVAVVLGMGRQVRAVAMGTGGGPGHGHRAIHPLRWRTAPGRMALGGAAAATAAATGSVTFVALVLGVAVGFELAPMVRLHLGAAEVRVVEFFDQSVVALRHLAVFPDELLVLLPKGLDVLALEMRAGQSRGTMLAVELIVRWRTRGHRRGRSNVGLQVRAPVRAQRQQIHVFDRPLQLMVAILAGASGGGAQGDPIGRAVTGAGEAVPLDEGFQRHDRMGVFGLPVAGDAAGHQPQNMTGQMRDAHAGQEEEAGVVGDPLQAAGTLGRRPTDPGIAGGDFPAGGAKEQTSQRPSVVGAHQVFEVLAHGGAQPQIMMAGHQGREQALIRMPRAEALDLQRLHRFQVRGERCRRGQRPRQLRPGTLAPAMGGGALAAGGQSDQPALMQFEHQGAGGHVLELAGVVLPVPRLAEPLGELAAAGLWMGGDQGPQLRQIFGTQPPTLDHQFIAHIQSMAWARSGVQQNLPLSAKLLRGNAQSRQLCRRSAASLHQDAIEECRGIGSRDVAIDILRRCGLDVFHQVGEASFQCC